jgi:heat shock protein HtpX
MSTYAHISANKRKTWILVILFFGFVLSVGWVYGQVYGASGISSIGIAAIIAIVMALFGYYKGDSVALATSGAKPLERKESPYVYTLVENLTIASGMPMPKIYLIPDPVPNAFATGRDPEHSSIAVTSGIVELLRKDELEGVLAHELSHIQNYDIRVMTIVIVLVGLVALASDFFLRMQFYGGGRRRSEGNAGVLLLVIGIVLSILSPLIAKIIQLAVSRKREFLADASGALLTRYPDGLARALKKIDAHPKNLRKANKATAHLYFSSPFGSNSKFFTKLFSTHPPITERISALNAMER